MGAGDGGEGPLGTLVSKSAELLDRQAVVMLDQAEIKALADSVNVQQCTEPQVGLPFKFDNDLQVREQKAVFLMTLQGDHPFHDGLPCSVSYFRRLICMRPLHC